MQKIENKLTLNELNRGDSFLVAQGKQASRSGDINLEIYFIDENLISEYILQSKKDFKQRELFRYATEGELLAKVIQHENDEDGMDVFGNKIDYENKKVSNLPYFGKDFVAFHDNGEFYAETYGVIILDERAIGIESLVHINENHSVASIDLIPEQYGKKALTVNDIKKAAANNGVKFGIDDILITQGLEEIKNQNFVEPNLVLVTFEEEFSDNFVSAQNIFFGLKESEIFHKRGMITKDEVRAVVIHKLRLPRKGVFWDIGAGSGAISVECALLNPKLKVYAIEKEPAACEIIKKNKEKFELFNLKIIKGSAPECLRELDEPDRVFIGGSGGKLKEILEFLDLLEYNHLVIQFYIILPFHYHISYIQKHQLDFSSNDRSHSQMAKLRRVVRLFTNTLD